ncbi:DNA polymerase III subunit gamma/tau [Aquamicrobium segne]|uniref:DNA polymerase III subunit gamma/tau n=1 Tax=Aquamicrobium segne TaxID=469547 RepID=A0ABW0H305_9HYPH
MNNAGASDQGISQAGPLSVPYRVLARKYRPSDFSQLIGQEPMVRTLTNAFSSGRIAQAWMLTGVRGVGKTTTARILARALNYRTSQIDRPCIDLAEQGEHCQAIMEGRHVDVIEMDAASHTGIDDIRDIIDRVRYAPVSARYKVYIIDEVHMLSTQAFNGLLKTLEEPPPHVKFIFATTEIRKVPITVLSRCQRFDLRRIDASQLVTHLSSIADQEGVAVDDEALAMIARAGEGSARDCLSILDQAIAHGGGAVSAEAVRAMLGLADRGRIIDLFEHLMKGDVAAALGEFRTQYDTGADPASVLTDLAEFNHLVTRLRFVPDAAADASLSEAERRRGLEFSDALSVKVLSRCWQMLLKGIPEVQSSNRPVSAAEMVLIRIAHAADLPTLDEALKALDSQSASAPRPQSAQSAPVQTPRNPPTATITPQPAQQQAIPPARPAPSGHAQVMRLVEAAEPVSFTAPPKEQPEPELPQVSISSLNDMIALADAQRDIAFKVSIKRYIRPVRIEPGHAEVNLTEDAPRTLLNELTIKLKQWTGRHWVVSLSSQEGGSTLFEAETQRRETALLDARNDPAVAAILEHFPGAKITDIRIPDALQDQTADGDMLTGPETDPETDDSD